MDFGTNVLLSAGVVAGVVVAVVVVVPALVISIIIVTVTIIITSVIIIIITQQVSLHTQAYLSTISWLACLQQAPPL